MVLILTILHKKQDAVKIGRDLLKARLIACYNSFPAESGYWWRGKIVSEGEIVMILKTKEQNFKKIETYIKKNSDYEVPEVVAIKPYQTGKSYLNWIEKEIV